VIKGNNTYTFDAAEFARLLGIPESRPIVSVRWSIQGNKAVVYVKPGSPS